MARIAKRTKRIVLMSTPYSGTVPLGIIDGRVVSVANDGAIIPLDDPSEPRRKPTCHPPSNVEEALRLKQQMFRDLGSTHPFNYVPVYQSLLALAASSYRGPIAIRSCYPGGAFYAHICQSVAKEALHGLSILRGIAPDEIGIEFHPAFPYITGPMVPVNLVQKRGGGILLSAIPRKLAPLFIHGYLGLHPYGGNSRGNPDEVVFSEMIAPDMVCSETREPYMRLFSGRVTVDDDWRGPHLHFTLENLHVRDGLAASTSFTAEGHLAILILRYQLGEDGFQAFLRLCDQYRGISWVGNFTTLAQCVGPRREKMVSWGIRTAA